MLMLRFLLFALLLALALPAHAQQLSPQDAQRALDVLQDPQKRADVIATLEAIAHAAPQPQPTATPQQPAAKPPPAAAPLPELTPNSLGADVLMGASHFLNQSSREAIATLGAVRSVPLLLHWLRMMATDPWARGILLDTAWRLALVLALSLATEWAINRSVRRPILALAQRAPNGAPPPDEDAETDEAAENGEDRAERGEIEPPHRRRLAALTLLRRLPLVFLRLILELLPVFGFLTVGHLVAATPLGGDPLPRLVLLAVIDAYALCVAILCVARMLFSPVQHRLRLLNVSDQLAAYAMRWIRRIAIVSVFGYAIAEVGLLLGLSDTAHDALLKAVGLIDHIFLAIIVLQRRRTVRRLIQAPPDATGMVASLRNWLARIWHWLAILLLAALWLTWAAQIPHGYGQIVRYFASIIAVAIAARLAQIVIIGALDRALTPQPDIVARYPGIETRLALYHPVLISVARAVIAVAALTVLLQLWGLGALDWLLASTLGHRLLSALVSVAVTLLLAIAIWESVNASLERHLAKLTRESQAARSARLRTLLPLLRSALLITILVIVGMMVLSEIGVNIGPLLAGAGIVGVAIGFGSQKLVQDLITGIFLLLENAMQVGDTVTVSGLSGTVENLSVRTIRLRAGDGSVHIIPFSSVTSVTNVNRGLGNAAVSVIVAAHEDTDRVSDVLKEIVTGMKAEPAFQKQMLSDLQLWGVDKVDGACVTIAGQVVCTDSGRWSVQREFNRRMKLRFQELGIELYNPMQQTVSLHQVPPATEEKQP
jgi:small-conductance mechanosensitive channel